MKKLYLLLVVVAILIGGCKKDSNQDNPISNWTINGKTFTAVKTLYSVADYALIAADNEDFNNAKNGIVLSFEEKPISSGAYTVVPWDKNGPYEGEVYIEMVVDGESYYETSGHTGDYASCSVLSGGKLKITFSNVTFIDENNNEVRASGTIIEQ